MSTASSVYATQALGLGAPGQHNRPAAMRVMSLLGAVVLVIAALVAWPGPAQAAPADVAEPAPVERTDVSASPVDSVSPGDRELGEVVELRTGGRIVVAPYSPDVSFGFGWWGPIVYLNQDEQSMLANGLAATVTAIICGASAGLGCAAAAGISAAAATYVSQNGFCPGDQDLAVTLNGVSGCT